MRSRPKLHVYLTPAQPTPGTQLVAEAALTSRSPTPIDGVVFELEGVESRYTHSSSANNISTAHYERHQHVALVGKSPAQELGVGEHRVSVAFALPRELPPSFEGPVGRVEYTLRVRVDIPWWPDRRQRYVVPLRLAPPSSLEPTPQRFTSSPDGMRDRSLYLEASLDSTTLELGGKVEGAVSLQNVAQTKIRRVEVAFVAIDHALVDSAQQRSECGRWALTLHEGAPVEGEALRFSTQAPSDACPSFRGRLLELLWLLEIRAVVAWGKDVVLLVPLSVTVPAPARARRERQRRVPPVGHERRALLWQEVAEKTKTTFDRDGERLRLEVGATGQQGAGVSLAVGLEHRGDHGLHCVAAIDWPDLGLGVQVAERKWVDTFRREVEIDDRALAQRAVVRGREAAQVRALLEPQVRAVLLGFERMALDDEGCELSSPGGAESAAQLEAFVWRSIEAAHLLASATARLPPPAAMASHVTAWKSFAGQHGGRFFPGDVRIEDATYGGRRLSVATRWNEEGAIDETLLQLALGASLAAELTVEDASRRLAAGTRARLERVRGELRVLRVGPETIEARLAGKLDDPHAAEPVLAALLDVARELSGAGEQGPYR